MKKLFQLLVFSPLLFVEVASAKNYIVLFKQAETSIASMEHGAFQSLLQTSNQKNVDQLKEWVGSRGISTDVRDLWIARGAALSLEDEAMKKLSHEAWVKGIYEDKVRRLISPSLNLVVGNSIKELGDETWGLEKIGVNRLHQEFPELDGRGVRVGIIDTGIQSRHQEFINKEVVFRDFINNISAPYDDHGHGTHVAGTITGNKVGIASEASIIFAKGFAAGGAGGDSGLMHAMQWIFDPDGNPATNDFPHVVSNSWGGELDLETIYDVEEFAPFVRAIQTWIHGGIIPVFAAGNSGKAPNGFPGGLPEPIAVGATTPSGELATFSSRGPNLWKVGESVLTLLKPDISAPGEKIISAFPGNKYATMAGTSMATPHVSGAIVLALQANPKLKFSDVKRLLLKSSEKKIDTQFGYGVLNAYELVKLAKTYRSDKP
jgi:subtilisin family serine protease